VGYDHDICLERKFARQIKAILGCQFITQSVDHDLHNGTDFEIFIVKPFTVGVRLRRVGYYQRFKNEFTLRWSRPSKVPTEIDKVRAGLVDYILYGFVNAEESKIVQYFIGDLAVFREHEPKPTGIFDNRPPDSQLAAYQLSSLPAAFLVKRWELPGPGLPAPVHA